MNTPSEPIDEERDIEDALDRNDTARPATLLRKRVVPKLAQSLAPICGQATEDAKKTPRGPIDEDRDIEDALDRNDPARAVALLRERYAPKLARSLAPICGQTTEDIVQTIFVQAWDGIASFKREVPARVWLRGIANHRAMDHLRSQVRARSRFAPLADGFEPEAPDGAVEDRADEPQRLRFFGEALGNLKPEVSFAIVLRHLEGFSFLEMEEYCGAKAPALERRVARGMNELRKSLKRLELHVGRKAPRPGEGEEEVAS